MRLKVTAREIRYAGKNYYEGEEFDATDKDGKLLVAIRKAIVAPAPRRGESRPPRPDPQPAAAPAPLLETASAQADSASEAAPRRRRRYLRRDVQAED